MGARAMLLLLADGRLPTGGHAHSGGLEAAVASGTVTDAADLGAWLAGRLATVGRVDASLAVAAHRLARRSPEAGRAAWDQLDAEWAARTPSPAQRRAARTMGRGLQRAAQRGWGVVSTGPTPWPLALGEVSHRLGLGEADAAVVAAHSAVAGPAWSATRLLSLDPFEVTAALASLAAAIDSEADGASRRPELASSTAPVLDIAAETHATREVRLFAS